MKLTPIQEVLVKEAFTHIIDGIDEEGSLPFDQELDGYNFEECSTNTLRSLQSRGFVKEFVKHQLGFAVTWDTEKVYDWVTM